MDAACDCGVAYVSAGKAAQAALKRNPTLSNRAIAAQIGVDESTVRTARQAGAGNPAAARTGRDGKNYPAQRQQRTVRDRAQVDTEEVNDFIRELLEFTTDYSNRIKAWHKANSNLASDDKKALMRTIHQCADMVLGLAQAIDGR